MIGLWVRAMQKKKKKKVMLLYLLRETAFSPAPATVFPRLTSLSLALILNSLFLISGLSSQYLVCTNEQICVFFLIFLFLSKICVLFCALLFSLSSMFLKAFHIRSYLLLILLLQLSRIPF